ncbi:hypothetical protein [Lacticaseibacillus suibinensis]|uniref:hypothetical protein n=1 Tax=Lacticaseibacillus suibinensis TaxID=2486011 RepID=UPI000F78E7E7|nr:hypothetical protein [Lacticaseibacillus suibinensis]
MIDKNVGDLITVSRHDLEELIRQRVAEAIRQPTGFTANTLFTGIAVDTNDIATINKRHGMPKDRFGVPGSVYSRHQYDDGNIIRNDGFSAKELHDKLRFLALAVVGETKNGLVTRADIATVREAYSKFRDEFLALYDDRAAKLAQEWK